MVIFSCFGAISNIAANIIMQVLHGYVCSFVLYMQGVELLDFVWEPDCFPEQLRLSAFPTACPRVLNLHICLNTCFSVFLTPAVQVSVSQQLVVVLSFPED